MEVRVMNEEVVVIDLIPESLIKDVLVVDKTKDSEQSVFRVMKDFPGCMKIGVETPAVIRVFKDRIEMDTVTPRVLDDDQFDILIDFKIKHKRFDYDNMLELNEFIKKITKRE